jgi:hypothetical protein
LDYVEKERTKKNGAGLVDPDVPVPGLPTYPWWNLVMAGPFQPIAGPGGPFLANRIIRAGEAAFILGAIWRNPAGIYWNMFSPNAVTMMSTMAMSVQFQTLDLTTGTPGPVIVRLAFPHRSVSQTRLSSLHHWRSPPRPMATRTCMRSTWWPIRPTQACRLLATRPGR